jgi:tRNA G18 (ribose-2'-O)-methylase SpoU
MSQVKFVAVLDNIRSLHNVGSIFRSADGASVGKLFLCGMTGTPPRSEIRKAALGAEDHVAWEYFKTTEEALGKLKAEGYHLVALENNTPRAKDFRNVEYEFPLALVIGHEYNGIAEGILSSCETVISLPMRGKKSSLNVAVAFGIAAYEISTYLQRTKE